MKIIVLFFAAIALTGCATGEYAQYSKAQTDIATARYAADAAKYKAMSDIAASGDSGAKIAAVMALALGAGSPQQSTQIAAPQPNQALAWAQILVPGLTQVAGLRYNYLGQKAASDNATALGISTNSTFSGIAGKIQAPGSVVNNTLSGTGTLGSGAYSTQAPGNVTTNTMSGTGTLGGGSYSLQDRHDVTTPAPVTVAPVVQVVPTVITPVTPIIPTVITPVTPIVPVTPTVPVVITPVISTAPVTR